MGSDGKFSTPKNRILGTQNVEEKTVQIKIVRCTECNQLIGVASTILYQIDKKHYCSACYSQKITSIAVERDHLDIKQEKSHLDKQQ